MFVPTYRETYVITAVFVDALSDTEQKLAQMFQRAYEEGNVAGFFEWQRMGRVTTLRLVRQVSEDEPVIMDLGREMTAENVVMQVADELEEAMGASPLRSTGDLDVDDAWNLISDVVKTLRLGEPHVTVEGLPCQAPRLRLVVDMTFKDAEALQLVPEYDSYIANNAMNSLVTAMGGDLHSYTLEAL